MDSDFYRGDTCPHHSNPDSYRVSEQLVFSVVVWSSRFEREKRKVSIKRFNYNLIYKIKEKEVFILAIIHGQSNPRTWEDRR